MDVALPFDICIEVLIELNNHPIISPKTPFTTNPLLFSEEDAEPRVKKTTTNRPGLRVRHGVRFCARPAFASLLAQSLVRYSRSPGMTG